MARVDDRCEACGFSVYERFPGDPPPAFCEACDDEFQRELRAGHVYCGDEPVYPVDMVH